MMFKAFDCYQDKVHSKRLRQITVPCLPRVLIKTAPRPVVAAACRRTCSTSSDSDLAEAPIDLAEAAIMPGNKPFWA